jgi:hypothetical protein
MKHSSFALALVLSVIVLGGCTAGSDSGAEPDIQLTSVGQNPTDGGSGVEVAGVAENYGSADANVTVTISLLNGSRVVTEKRLALGKLEPNEIAEFSTTFDTDPDEVDGRQITFDW